MGEKEQGTAREAGSGLAAGRESASNVGKGLRAGTTGDPDFDTARASNLPNDLDEDGGGTLDEGQVSVLKQKTKSNQSNDRLGQENDPGESSPGGIAIGDPGVNGN